MIKFLHNEWPSLCEIAGATLEIVGAVLLANRYIAFRWWQSLQAILSALVNGRYAHEVAELASFIPEREIYGLRGLGFLMAGFFIRTLPAIVHVISYLFA